MKQAK